MEGEAEAVGEKVANHDSHGLKSRFAGRS
jgi:hypothetical protein